MPVPSRPVNVLAALCVLAMVAGVLAVFVRSTPSTRSVSVRVGVAALSPSPSSTPSSAAPTTGASVVVPTTTRSTTTVAKATTSAAPLAPEPSVTHPAAVGTQSFVFVDSSRSTPPAGGDPGESSRTLPTIVRYPTAGSDTGAEAAGAPARPGGHPFPLVVFAHGYDSSPDVYAGLLHFWASVGFVVAAPSFPRAMAGGPLDENDVENQPGDVSFVITKVLALTVPGGPLAGIVDPARIGVAGHSDGASTTGAVGFNSCCRDARVLADAVMEGDEHAYPGGQWFPAGAEPALLVIQADHDVLNPPSLGLAVYGGGRSPKYLLWLVNADHLTPYTTDAMQRSVVEAVTTAFFDCYLVGQNGAAAAMRQAAKPGLATLTAA